jgi:DNA-binding GntR family transcriptional regulator
MTAQQVLDAVASMPREDWMKIQCGIAEMMAADFSPEEVAEIRAALEESDAEIARGEVLTSDQLRKQLGLS